MSSLIEPGAVLEKVASGAIWAEGPVWIAGNRTVRFSDIPNNRILQFAEDSGELTVYREDVEFTNGRTLDLDGSVIQCSHGRRVVERDRDGVV
jgi:gluconolactonase